MTIMNSGCNSAPSVNRSVPQGVLANPSRRIGAETAKSFYGKTISSSSNQDCLLKIILVLFILVENEHLATGNYKT